MSYKEILHNCNLAADIAPGIGSTTLVWQKESAGFDMFNFLNKDAKPISIQDDADYLKLFMQIAEQIFRQKKDKATTYLCACTLGGENLLFKPYLDSEKETFKYSYIAVSNALKQMPPEDRPDQLNFFSEINYEIGTDPRFEKESQKVAKVLKGQNREDWLEIIDNRHDFLKTDMYVFSLQRLHSWGFQIVKPGDEVDTRLSLVRPVKPKPRGALRKRPGKGK